MAEWYDAPVGSKVQSEAITAPEAAPTDNDLIAVVYPDGSAGTVPRSELRNAIVSYGARPEGAAETEARATKKRAEGHQVDTAIRSFGSVATFGGTDLLAGAVSPQYAKETKERREENFAGHLTGSVLGAFTPLGAGGVTTAAGRLAEGALVRAAGKEAAKKFGTKLAGTGTRGATEGALFGLGTGVSELGLDEKPITWEGAAATIGSNVLGGAAIGGAVNIGGKLFAESAKAAKGYAQKQVQALTKGADDVERGAFPEVANMDAQTAAKAHAKASAEAQAARADDIVRGKVEQEAELAALSKARDDAAAAYYKKAETFVANMRKAPKISVDDSMDARVLGRKKLKVMQGLDNAPDFIAKRGKGSGFEKGLEEQQTVLQRVLADSDDIMKNIDVRQSALADSLPKPKAPLEPDLYGTLTAEQSIARQAEHAQNRLTRPQALLYAEWAGVTVPKGKSLSISSDELEGFRRAIEVGDVVAPEVRRVQLAQQQLEANQRMYAKLKELQEPLGSAKLKEIEDRIALAKADAKPKTEYMKALEEHQAGLQEKSLGRTIAQGLGGAAGGAMGSAVAGPMIGGIGGAFVGRDIGNRLYDRFVRKIVSANAQRGKTITGTIAKMFEKGASASAKALPHATKIIPAIQYTSKEYADGVLGPARASMSKSEAVSEFLQRSREINALTERVPGSNTYQVRMQALQALHDQTTGLWAISAAVANGVEKLQEIKLTYLASKIPRDPTPPHLQTGPDTWEPTRTEIAKFARIMQVAEDPVPAVERVAEGTATPDDVETLKAIWPAHYDEVRQLCMEHLATIRHQMPYAQRLNLGLLLDVPVDPALTPQALSVYQRPKPDPKQQQTKSAPLKSMPMGTVEPTAAQRMSSR